VVVVVALVWRDTSSNNYDELDSIRQISVDW
jgi:hypothetical protein